MISPTSAWTTFIPHVQNLYEDARDSHHTYGYVPGCRGCTIAAEGVLAGVFRQWEWFVKEALIDSMCGAQPRHVRHTSVVATPLQPSRLVARGELLRSRFDGRRQKVREVPTPQDFLLLHNPSIVIAISRYWTINSPVENVFRAHGTQIAEVLTIRHGLAHGTQHAQQSARRSMLNLDPLRTYPTIGSFLLGTPQVGAANWLEIVIGRMVSWALQISP